ncbi:MAG TPA: histidine phosphatase family protein [Patescibacteria group bacterium]|nr:histidine phosphatase family protein [Patescibacteria group bacterium]
MTDRQPAVRARSASGRFVAKPEQPAGPASTHESEPEEGPMSSLPPEAAPALQLYLLRHADAGDPMAWPGDDAERPLSAKGKRQARRLGSLLADIGWKPDVILTSPKVRAVQTARLVGRAVEVTPQDEARLASAFELSDLGSILAAHPDARRVVLVGHDPDFSSIASTLSGAAIELRKGAIARIDLADSEPAAGGGALRWLIPPGVVPD